MKVSELISILQRMDQDLPVAYKLFSEKCLLEELDLTVQNLCVARKDGWVHNARPDKETIPYLVFPGN